ncbi:MAG: IS1634 family transposase [Syntrophobacteraceae bacterium]
MIDPQEIEFCDAYHLPIIKAYADRIDLVSTINRLVPTNMEIDPGTLVLAMILDAVSGRHPLYRIDSFYKNKDIELLLGQSIDVEKLTDDNFGRMLEHLYDANTSQLYTAIVINALRTFKVPTQHIHYDTTSMNVFGQYNSDSQDNPRTVKITKGYSKDHRPDLNQFVVSLLCTGGNVPIFSRLEDGNASDKKLNNTLLTNISKKLADVGIDPAGSIYIADSALVTEDNLRLMGDETLFITRLPATFGEHQRLVEKAVQSEYWHDYGILAATEPTKNRPGVHYRGHETAVTLYEKTLRAVVVHSSAHDRRRQKRLDREVEQERAVWSKKLAHLHKTLYFCEADARAAMARLQGESLRFHDIELLAEERPLYARGRPKADGSRALKEMCYAITGILVQKPEAIDALREQAGCFVLITNVPPEGLPNSNIPYDGKTVLQAYKDQNGIEHNFSFLKDPVLINSVFLKKPERIEAPGLILVLSLLIWRLIELQMRSHLEKEQTTIPGWDNKPTERPTTFMMATKFDNIRIIKIRQQRALNGRLSDVQERYLVALGLTITIFTEPTPCYQSSG